MTAINICHNSEMGSYAALNKIRSPQLFWVIYFSLLQNTYILLYGCFFIWQKNILLAIFMKQCIHMHIYTYIYT